MGDVARNIINADKKKESKWRSWCAVFQFLCCSSYYHKDTDSECNKDPMINFQVREVC
jgi:hypothetical protein